MRARTNDVVRCLPLLLALFGFVAQPAFSQDAETIRRVSERMVKLFGAGGLGRIEAYGSGFLVSPNGHILTILNPLLDAPEITSVLADGRRLPAKLLAIDSVRELALLKVEGKDFMHFDLAETVSVEPGDLVLGFSNLFNIAAGSESVSVQRGVLAAHARLTARQGFNEFTYRGKVYVIDAPTNNPGAAGGALVDHRGRLLGIIGKEVKNALSETWVHYALPIDEFRELVRQVIAGKYKPTDPVAVDAKEKEQPRRVVKVDLRGIVPLPDVLDRTPAFIDAVQSGSPAEKAGLKADDLVLFVGESLVQSVDDFRVLIDKIPADQKVRLVVLRGQNLISVELPPRGAKSDVRTPESSAAEKKTKQP